MCIGAEYCVELGKNPEFWSKECPLPPPPYFGEALAHFIKAFNLALSGNIESSLKALKLTRSDDLRDWYVNHGQMSGHYHRVKILNKAKPSQFRGSLDIEPKFKGDLEESIFMRDGYRCRYCGIKVVNTKSLVRLEKVLGKEHFQPKAKVNSKRHGISFAFRATVDHVVPHSSGGRTSYENGVTACWNCNIGKLDAHLSQMGIDDPRDREPKYEDAWNGLI
jgi:hypothetical protein